MAKIAFIGLGQMGTPIATRLIDAGHHLSVWDRTPDHASTLSERGAEVAATPGNAAAGADFIWTMLATAEVVEDVLFGAGGLATGLGLGQLLIEMSTIGPNAFLSIASRLPSGVHAVDAPVRGSVPEATAGTLHVFVGASDEDFATVRPILEALGDVRHAGGPGAGASMKLVANLTLGVTIVAFGEALALGSALGLRRDDVIDVLAQSSIGPTVAGKRGNVEARTYPPSFKLRHATKDMRLVDEAAGGAGIELIESHAARTRLEAAMDEGFGDFDFSAVVATILGESASVG
ncbi:MAG TPA: NAD(P)-dependent oxidoreductase [Actinomycetota bacterium]|nr:NAD(P)-dependent oxidoreductase [Actinomycetota bacterium]